MNVGSRVSRFAAFAGLVAASLVGAPATGLKSSAPPPMQIVDTTEKNVRRRLRRPRAEILRRALTWRGFGLLSKGPRFPKVRAAQPTGEFARTIDKQLYVRVDDGSFRRVPQKARGKATVKLHKRLRQAARKGSSVVDW